MLPLMKFKRGALKLGGQRGVPWIIRAMGSLTIERDRTVVCGKVKPVRFSCHC